MVKITQWGNAPGGLRIPAALLREAGLRTGDYVHIRLMDSGDLRVRPARERVPAEPLKEPELKVTPW
jgi:antitoxin MazE